MRDAQHPDPSPGRSGGREGSIVYGPDGDREDVEGVFERWARGSYRQVRVKTVLAQHMC